MPMPATLAALAGRPIVTMTWDLGYTANGSSALWAGPGNGAYSSGSQYMPFNPGSPSTGESPTSYNYAGVRDVLALDGDACVIGASLGGSNYQHRAAFYDLLWMSPIISGTTTATTVGSATLPARDNLGGTNGENCMLVAWNSGGNPTISATYTNSAGVGSRTASVITSNNGGPWPLSFAAGDTGVGSVQDITTSTTGAIRLGIVRRLAIAERAENVSALASTQPTGQRPTSRLHNIGVIQAGALIFPVVSVMGTGTPVARTAMLELAML